MVGLEDGADAGVEVVVVEVVGDLFAALEDDREVAADEVEALEHRVDLVEAGLREDQHHEGVQQLLVLYQLHVAPRQLRPETQHLSLPHLPQEDRQQFPVPREVLPHYPPVVAQEHLGLVPHLRHEPVEQLLVLPVEQQPRPLRVLTGGLLEPEHQLLAVVLLTDGAEHVGLPVVEVGLAGTADAGTGPDLDDAFLAEGGVGGTGEGGDDLVLDPGEPEEGVGDELLEGDEFLEADAVDDELDDAYEGVDEEAVVLAGVPLLGRWVPRAPEVPQVHQLLVQNQVQDLPDELVLQQLVLF